MINSCNTNLSKSGKLPVLLNGKDQYEGYIEISQFICDNFDIDHSAFTSPERLSAAHSLIDLTVINLIENKLRLINQYNLYIVTTNYENVTRKLFKNYLPFPMMYNQPLKFYNIAQEEVKLIGIGKPKGFLGFGTGDNDDDLDKTVPLSKLHEQQLLSKNKEKLSIRESKNLFRACSLLDNILRDIIEIYKVNQLGLTRSNILLLAYIHTLSSDLPDKSLLSIIQNHEEFYQQCSDHIKSFNDQLKPIKPCNSSQSPNLLNEIHYKLSQISASLNF
ncbi:hypothetical protein CLIB1444_01S04764 [[Candida] jaroonii]|uniref:Uncharacterized protein n=1 Tax=[Candida] jaroonii TaxID=467808 RepID=A0ACA9Y0B3_9ASCO|nr:hypothetical protein CLIB1444_01S04764 [[Candida] jaroonii]